MESSSRRVLWIKVRMALLAAALLAGAVAVGRGAWDLGVTRRDALLSLARQQYVRTVRLSAKRGLILDRYGEELAVEVEVDSIYADPREVRSPKKTARRLARALGVDAERLYRRLASQRHFVWVRRRVNPDERARVAAMKLPGIHFLKESKRFYPGKELAAHVVGFAGIDSRGLEGTERLFEEQLRGDADALSGLADAKGNIVFADDILGNTRLMGDNVVLTIDRNLQFHVERELERTVRLFHAKAGHVIVMDPRTGDVLAMANWPTFNLNRIGASTPDSRRNRAVLDVYEPGSTMKVFTLAAALNSGKVRPDDLIFCERGRMQFYDVVINDDHRDGWLRPSQCLKRSSNICFVKIAQRLGKERLYRYLRRFGFGERTGVQVPYEMRGMLPHYSQWSEFLTATIAFGQGVGVTGIQMATALSAIANGGKLMRPNLVARITDADGNVLYENKPQVVRRVVSPRTARLVTDMMTTVVEEGGTGEEAALEGYLVAGKTGTAQKSEGSRGYADKSRFVASFFGFVPADHPRFVISVVIDEPLVSYYGGQVAAPAMRRIAQVALRDYGIPPNVAVHAVRRKKKEADDQGRQDNQVVIERARRDARTMPVRDNQVRMPDVLGLPMTAAITRIEKAGLRPLFFGSGLAIEQVPEAGVPVDVGSFVQVNFAPYQREDRDAETAGGAHAERPGDTSGRPQE